MWASLSMFLALLSRLPFRTGFCKSTLLQVNLGLIGMQAAWPESGTHYSRSGAQTYVNMITTAVWKAAMRQYRGDHFGLYLQNAHFQRKTFGWSVVLLQVLARS